MMNAFSFGYYGWGNHTPQMVESMDAVEQARGFKPPVFVDIRYKRYGRAAGFIGDAFPKLVGSDRYFWKQGLGNADIGKKDGKIRIARPETASELLSLIAAVHADNRRVIFFCACQTPRHDNCPVCHRYAVVQLLREAAKQRSVELNVEEWPGGDQQHVEFDVMGRDFTAIANGGWWIPMRCKPANLAELATVPWGSIATIRTGNHSALHRYIGPLQYRSAGWTVPIVYQLGDNKTPLEQYEDQAEEMADDWRV